MNVTAAAFIAHVLAVHLAVPEPVQFRLVDQIGPGGFERDKHAPVAMVRRDGPGWLIEYERPYWDRYPEERTFLLAHELCHAAYDYEVRDWWLMPKKERDRRHLLINQCARQILREHEGCNASNR